MKDIIVGIATTIGAMMVLALLGFVADYAHEKLTLLKSKVKSEAVKQLIDKVDGIIRLAVEMTNQTLVDDQKANGSFDDAAKQQAFLKTFSAVDNMLSETDKEQLEESFGDFKTFIKANIETYIKDSKAE